MMDMYDKGKALVTTTRMAARTLCATLILLLLTAGAASATSAATITVDDSGGADYTSIQAAVNNASGGYVNGDGVVDAWDCTYMAQVIVGE